MAEGEAFLREIIAVPDDDGPRLVYADWLEERADPRGEFIRVQCEEARLEDCARRKKLRSRAKQLLQAHGKQWTDSLDATGAGNEFRDPEYHRGFVETAKMSLRFFLRSGAGVMTRTPLRCVTLTSGDSLLPQLAQAEHLRGLRDLHFLHNEFPEADAIEFVQSPSLANLRSFRLHGYRIHTNDFGRALVGAPFQNLTALDLGFTRPIAADWVETFLEAPWLHGIESLRLRELSDAAVREVAASPRLVKLKDWDLSALRLPLSAQTGRALAESPMAARMEQLKLEGRWMDANGLRALAAGNWTLLHYLNFNDAHLGTAGVQALAAGNWPALRVLNLAAAEMGSTGLAALLSRPWLKSLERLSLRGNNLTRQDVLDLIASPNWSHTTDINLAENQLTREDAQEIQQNLGRIGSLRAELRRVTEGRGPALIHE